MQNESRKDQPELQRIYFAVLANQERFDEFKQMLALYPASDEYVQGTEPAEAMKVRDELNARITEWAESPGSGLSAHQTILLRQMLVEQRENVALSPWKESNTY